MAQKSFIATAAADAAACIFRENKASLDPNINDENRRSNEKMSFFEPFDVYVCV